MGRRFPDHCCCCSLRPGALVIGGCVIAVCLTLTVVLGMKSTSHKRAVDQKNEVESSFYMVVYLYWLNAALNAIEIVFTIGLFYGIYKHKEKWVTRWLFVSVGWWTEHSVFSMSIIMSAIDYQPLLFATFVGPFLFFLGYRCIKTVAGLREEMLNEDDEESRRYRYSSGDGPTSDSADADANAIASTSADDNVQL